MKLKGWAHHHRQQKDDCQPSQQNVERNLVGIFCRSAPSTKAIIRSRKVSPGFEVILTLILSERTRVPPVTAERSPPASRGSLGRTRP